MKYLVSKVLSIEVEAESEDEAITQSEQVPERSWELQHVSVLACERVDNALDKE